jgi:hypothetical protein
MFNPPAASNDSEEDIAPKNRKFFSVLKIKQEFYISTLLTLFVVCD